MRDLGMRYEMKYHLPVQLREEILAQVRPHMEHDRYCIENRGKSYTVRSIYYDSDDRIFYFEKRDSVNIRRKVRVRTYDRPDDRHPAFIEIKRKFGRVGCKDRLMLPLGRVDEALNGKDPQQVLEDASFRNRTLLERIRFLTHTKQLQPVVLVAYDREAMIGLDNERVRVTFDRNIRSLMNPRLEQIYNEDRLRQFEDRFFILELKFDEMMPRWMAAMIRNLNLQPQSYSKYCFGIDAWQSVPE